MNRFFWVTIPENGDVTIAEKLDDRMYMIPGSSEIYDVNGLIVGSEIKFERTGFLAALNDVK